jgi:hypothetical protein
VATKLDQELTSTIMANKFRLVILAGNAVEEAKEVGEPQGSLP